MPLNTASAQVKLRDLTATFDLGVRSQTPFYPQVCTVAPSDGYDENYGWLGAMPSIREWIGDRVFNELRAATYLLVNKKWEGSVNILEDDIEDDRLNQYMMPLSRLGVRAAQHPDNLWFQVLQDGETELAFDGRPFFDTAHLWGESGTQSNDLTSPGADPVNPSLDEFTDAYHQARSAMLAYRDDWGEFFVQPVVQMMSQLLLLVPLGMEKVAKRMVNAELINGGETNFILDTPQVVSSPFLSAGNKFYLFNLGDVLKPFVFQTRQAIRRQMKGMGDREFKDVKFMTDARYNAGYLAWWNAVLTTFT